MALVAIAFAYPWILAESLGLLAAVRWPLHPHDLPPVVIRSLLLLAAVIEVLPAAALAAMAVTAVIPGKAARAGLWIAIPTSLLFLQQTLELASSDLVQGGWFWAIDLARALTAVLAPGSLARLSVSMSGNSKRMPAG